mmetsp:Transcript_66551/g.124163  ORF Transcript_66551/g.124163 Transcript_66551/m.124163 type:complete len:282 (-) Transcript_66551:47-892(-)
MAGFNTYSVTCTLERCVDEACHTCDDARLLQDVGDVANRAGSEQATAVSIRVAPGISVMTLPGRAPDVVLVSPHEAHEVNLVPAVPANEEAACCFRFSIQLAGPGAVAAAAGKLEEEYGSRSLETALGSVLQADAGVTLESVMGVSAPLLGGEDDAPVLEAMEALFMVTALGDSHVQQLAQKVQDGELQTNFSKLLAQDWQLPPEVIVEFGQPSLLVNISASNTSATASPHPSFMPTTSTTFALGAGERNDTTSDAAQVQPFMRKVAYGLFFLLLQLHFNF